MKYTGMKRRSYKSITPLRRLQEIYLYFFLYCVIGWLYEVFLEVVIYRWGFSNRGVLFGPYLAGMCKSRPKEPGDGCKWAWFFWVV